MKKKFASTEIIKLYLKYNILIVLLKPDKSVVTVSPCKAIRTENISCHYHT